VITSPFEAGVTVLALNENSNVKAAVDGQSIQIDGANSADAPGTQLLTIKPHSGGKSGDYEIRLSV
jgi:hypothetical protein